MAGGRRLIRAGADHSFTNCPRNIEKMAFEEGSVPAPREGHGPPDPAWKSMPFVQDIFGEEREHTGSA